jgi:hypothetical protein
MAELRAAESEREAERMEREAERMERYAERMSDEIERTVEQTMQPQAVALHSNAAARVNSMRLSCAGREPTGAWDEAEAAARCETHILATTRQALEVARHSIATDAVMPEPVRREVLQELDREIASLSRS